MTAHPLSETRPSTFRFLLIALILTSLLMPVLARPAASDQTVRLAASSAPPTPAQGSVDAGRATTEAIVAALGPCNRGEPRIWFAEYKNGTYQVRFNINDLMAFAPTRAFARKDVLDIVRVVKSTDLPIKRLAVVGAFPMPDGYGNFSNVVVMSLIFSAQTVARMNPDGIDWLTSNAVYAAADQRQVADLFVAQ